MMKERSGHLGDAVKEFSFKSEAERSFLAGIGLLVFALMGLYFGIRGAASSRGAFDYLIIIASLFVLIGSVFVFRHARFLNSMSIQLFEEGFVVEIKQRSFPFVWDEIAQVNEIIIRRRGTSIWHLLVTRSDSESFRFSEHEVDDAAELREAIRQNTAAHGVPWETEVES